MNDLLKAQPDAIYLQRTAKKVLKGLVSLHLMVAPDKVQMIASFGLLGFSIAKQLLPLSFKL